MRSSLSTLRIVCLNAWLVIMVVSFHGSALGAGGNRCFDMGGLNSVLKTGYFRVTEDSLYDKQKGYGWIKAPEEEVTTENDPTVDELTRDGVVSSQPMEFRVDLASGSYFGEVTVGKGGEADADVRVYADGSLVARSGRFVDLNGGRSRRTLRFPLEVKLDSALIGVASDKGRVELNGIAFKVPAYRPFSVEKGKFVGHASLAVPAYERGKKLFEVGQYDMALKQFATIPDTALRAYCSLVVGSRLEVRNAKTLIRDAARALAQYAGSDDASMTNRFELVQKFLLAVYYYDLGGWNYAEQQTGLPVWQRFLIAADLLEQVAADPRDPLYHQALWYLGRLWYWMWREQHGGYQRREADRLFALLAQDYPEFDLLSMYRGKKIPHTTDYSQGIEGAPSWAVAQREALARLLEVIDYWVGIQNINGELGGGYSDDCEMLRWWPVAVFAVDEARAREGMRRLAEGIWNSGIIEKGYSAQIADVEHSAEPTSDTQPIMIGVDYGNPVYVERCMATMKCMRDVWAGVNSRGHLHFKSAWFSATRYVDRPPYAVDVPMNARAVKPGRWLCWYNNNPNLIKLMSDWGKAWVEDTRRTDGGKPEGIVPAAVSFATDAIGGYSNSWYHPNLSWDYYNWEAGGAGPMYDQFLALYDLTGDFQFVYPIEKGLEIARDFSKNPVEKPQEGSLPWAAKLLNETGFAQYGSALRTLTHSTRFDDYLRERGAAYTKFLLTGDKSVLVEACQDSANSTKYNFPLLTTEAKFTDRVSVRGADELLSMYTGSAGLGTEYPYHAVSWSNTTRNFAVLVLNARSRLIKVLVYNFEPADRSVMMRLWRLEPGQYQVRIGPDVDGNGEFDGNATEKTMQVVQKGTALDVNVPSRKQTLIEISQTSKAESVSALHPDLALTQADVAVEPPDPRAGQEASVRVAIHNIGSAPANKVVIALMEGTERLGEQTIDTLDAPNDLEPKVATVSIKWQPSIARTHRLIVTVDPDDTVKEIYDLNNTVRFDAPVAR